MPPERILIVDDDAAFRERLARAFRERGFEVEGASDVASAKAAATARTPDVALVDLGLPDGSGLDVVSDIHALDRGTRIFMLTGVLSPEVRSEAHRRGAVGCLRKPLDADEIISAFAAGPPPKGTYP